MKTILSSRIRHYWAVISIFLIMVALIAGIAGCNGDGNVESYTLTISGTSGGSVTEPEQATSTHDEGTVVNLVAEPEEGYTFVKWTGEVDTVADVNDATTTITMSDDYHIAANFAPVGSFTAVSDWHDLDAIREDLNGDYLLMNDLDSTTAGYDELAGPAANQGKGWDPIGTYDEPFMGTLDGQGYEVRDMVINRPARNYTGLFGAVGVDVAAGGVISTKGVVENLGVVNAAVTGDWNVGGVAGLKADTGAVTSCYFTGEVTGKDNVGGLMGFNYGNLSDSYATAIVSGDRHVGGLVGFSDGTVSNCYATASVTGNSCVGGLIGSVPVYSYLGKVSDCYSTGTVIGDLYVGGLVGLSDGTVSNCYATGSVTGGVENAGGLVGLNRGTVTNSYSTGSVTGYVDVGSLVGASTGSVLNSYSTGSVTGKAYVGGLVGTNDGDVSNCYSTGSVTGDHDVGGLVARNYQTVTNSFWDTQTSGQSASDGGTGKATAEMKSTATFSTEAWNIIAVASPSTRNVSYIWNIVDGQTYPFLSWQSV